MGQSNKTVLLQGLETMYDAVPWILSLLTKASFVFLEGHDNNFVEIHNVVKFLADGLCKNDIYKSVETQFLCM